MKVELNREELLILNRKCSGPVQEMIDEEKQIIHLEQNGLTNIEANIIRDSIKLGFLKLTHRNLDKCSACGIRKTYYKFKRGRRIGQCNYNRPQYIHGISFNDGFVTIAGYSKFGFCNKCGAKIWEKLCEYILNNDLKIELMGRKENKYIKDERMECFQCGKKMYKSEMGLKPALFSGDYPSICPHCGVASILFGKSHKIINEFRMIEKERGEDNNVTG